MGLPILKMFAGLILILGGLLIVMNFVKQVLQHKSGKAEDELIKVVATKYIGIKKSVALVKVPGSLLVLGITNDSISMLAKLEHEEQCDAAPMGRNDYQFSEALTASSMRFEEEKTSGRTQRMYHSFQRMVKELNARRLIATRSRRLG
ncbi:MAG: flagellar biosynthetic protein FliO [Deltaproteobacteria bacterium]|nr:flagellar biosynthetic protein FliO [Deltaproteobacteria bacterium]